MFKGSVQEMKFKAGRLAAVLALAAGMLIAWPVSQAAAQAAGGGFSGPGPALSTAAEALKMKDDVPVSLKGKIVKNLGDEKYLFQDSSGSIEVEIDGDIWRGQNITPEDVVVISGEIDKDWNHTSVDVSTIQKQ